MPAAIPYLKQGDTARDITDTLLIDGDPIVLTGATMIKSAGTTSRTVYVDWVWYGCKFTTAR